MSLEDGIITKIDSQRRNFLEKAELLTLHLLGLEGKIKQKCAGVVPAEFGQHFQSLRALRDESTSCLLEICFLAEGSEAFMERDDAHEDQSETFRDKATTKYHAWMDNMANITKGEVTDDTSERDANDSLDDGLERDERSYQSDEYSEENKQETSVVKESSDEYSEEDKQLLDEKENIKQVKATEAKAKRKAKQQEKKEAEKKATESKWIQVFVCLILYAMLFHTDHNNTLLF